MFCKNCGAQLTDGTKFCSSCGTPVDAPAQPVAPVQTEAPVQPVAAPQASNANFDLGALVATIKKYIPIIIACLAVFALILSIINIFNLYDVSATMSMGEESQSSSGPVSDIIGEDGFALVLVGNILFGVANLVIAAMGILYFIKKFGVNVYDMIVGKIVKAESPLFMMCVIGAAIALIQILFYAFSGESQSMFGYEISVSVSANWTTWVAMFLYAIVGAADKFLISKKAK